MSWIVDKEGYLILTEEERAQWGSIRLHDPPNGYITLTEEEYAEWVAKDTPLGLPPPDEDWDEPELTPPDGQPLNCYHCGQVTRTLRWGMPICASCDKLCRRDHAHRRA